MLKALPLLSLPGLLVSLSAVVFALSSADLAVLVFALVNAALVSALYPMWKEDFGHRRPRSDPCSPSYNKMAKVSAACPAVKDFETPGGPRRLSRYWIAEGLDMDHVYLSFKQFVWCCYWIAPHTGWLWISGIVGLLLRQRLQRMGWVSPKPHEPDRVVAKMLLEGVALLMHYSGKVKVDGRVLALFVWNDFPMLNQDGIFETAANLTIEVDLTSQRMAEAKLDGVEITASDAMTLVWFNTIFAAHPKIHASGNWGVNVEGTLEYYVKQCGVITVIYNYFGYVQFTRMAEIWRRLGWIDKSWEHGIQAVIDHGLQQGIHDHGGIRELRRHSEVGDFILKVRKYFLNVFAQHKDTFPGIDGEALFVGTILHSLDHTMAEWNLEDPLWLDTSSLRFGLMAEMGRFVRAGFIEDLPGLPVRRHFSDSPLPFFQEIYRHAVKINKRLADHMDTCIAK